MRQQIKEYDSYYIYENGDVLNISTNRMLKGSISEHGYKYYRLSKNNVKQMFYAHRLVAEYFIPNPNNLPVVNHIDGNKLNNNKDNLEWVSYSENMAHAHETNLIKTRKESIYYQNDLLNEEWRQIYNYHYSISSYGRVRNDKTLLLLQPSIACGYQKVRLSQNGVVTDIMIHKMVYCIFSNIDNVPEGYTIDHIDGNKLNNNINNLRLLDLSSNVLASYYEQQTNTACKRVQQLTLTNQVINIFPSCAEAARQLNLDASTISKVCRGKNKSHGGFRFQFVE